MKSKLSKISIIVAALCISANAQSLQDSLKDGTFNGEIRSTTVLSSTVAPAAYSEAGINNNAKSSSIGIQLNYTSAPFYGFNVGLGFQAAHDLGLHDDSNPSPVSGEKEPRTAVSGANMYVGYLGYTKGATNVKVGKQIIMTTLMANSNTFALRDSFNGISISNKDIPNTQVEFYAIKDWYERYHADVGNTRVTHFDKPLYSLFVKNKSFDNLSLEGQYLTTSSKVANNDKPVGVSGGYSTYYGAFDYKLPISHPVSIGAFYAGANFDNGDANAKFIGAKVGSPLPYLGYVKLAYTTVSDKNNFPGALGHVPNFFKYNGGQMFTDNIFAGMNSTSLLVIPKLIPGVKTLFSYAKYSQSAAGQTVSNHNLDGASEIQADFRYKFKGALKGLSARLQLALIDYDLGTDDDKLTTSRIYLNFKF